MNGNPSARADNMTLRQWYAAHALIGILASYPRNVTPPADIVAKACFECAEAMLTHEAELDRKRAAMFDVRD